MRLSRPAGIAAAVGFAAAFAALGGCASSPHRLAADSDRELSSRANQALSAAGFDSRRIEARSYRGVIALLGEGADGESREAQRVVLAVPGVVRVNNLVLNEGPSTASGFSRARTAPIIARAREGREAKEEEE